MAHAQRRYVIGHQLDATNTKGGLAEFDLNLPVLLRSRLLVQARSGGGKSFLIRRLLEQTHGHVQHLVIDVEGEFASLRERFDYVLASKDGDTPADPRAARLLAERLLELKASAILDLYELKMADRIRFVHLFLDALVNAPKHLWHPVLLVIDEAHIFCPQQDRADNEAAGSVIDLLTRGRKRGFCAVLATQRLSKLHKDAAAECQNKMIGGTTLDVDQRRASDELGFSTREDRIALRKLKPGQFFAYGPALSNDVVVKVQVGPVMTKHPKPGSRLTFKAPPPTKHIKMMLPKLADLPREAEQREQTTRELKRELSDSATKIRTLERELATVKAEPTKTVSIVDKKTVKNIEYVSTLVKQVNLTHLQIGIQKLDELLSDIKGSIDRATGGTNTPALIRAANRDAITETIAAREQQHFVSPTEMAQRRSAVPLRTDNAEARILAALKQYGPSNASKVGARAGVSPNVSTFRLAISRLRKLGYLDGDRNSFGLTTDGLYAAANVPPLPTGADALGHWRGKLGTDNLPRRIFETLIQAGPGGAPPLALTSNPNVSTFRLAIGKLKKLGIITGSKNRYFISEELSQ